ncbi:inovirus Gp2 family protein, partial [Vibrio anguillarum]|nr:inovirus Gp2 family protein [Vibrio anguillarum]
MVVVDEISAIVISSSKNNGSPSSCGNH